MGGMFVNVTWTSAITMALAMGPLALEEGRIQGEDLNQIDPD